MTSKTTTAQAAYYDRSFWERAEQRAAAKQAKRDAEMEMIDARLEYLSESFSDASF